MSLVLITPPALEPVTLAEAKLHCKVDSTDDDTLLAIYITSARAAAEHETGRALVTQTWELLLDAFPCDEVELPKPNVLSITSVKYTDTDGVEQTIGSPNYTFDNARLTGWLLPAVDYAWPSTQAVANAVRVRFTAGYGAAASDVPANVRHWMLMQIGAAYRNRDAFAAGFSVAEYPNRFVDHLLDEARTYL